MNEDVKGKWVAALTSGEFTQGHGALIEVQWDEDGEKKDAVGYCCLGVLTMVAIREGCPNVRRVGNNIEWWQEERQDTLSGIARWTRGHGESLPPPVAEWAGLGKAVDPIIDGISAINRNDGEGQTFEQIAAAIKRDPDL